jgi:Ca-activated chloride channel family protein
MNRSAKGASSRRLAATLLGVIGLTCALPQRVHAQPAGPLVIQTEVISVPVTVSDRRGRFVADLEATDFDVLEDNTPQEITSFEVEESGVATVLLLDCSGSMTASMEVVKRAATQFIQQMGPDDVASVIQFDTAVKVQSEFTSNKAALVAAVNGVVVSTGATALRNALWRGLSALEARRADDRETRRHRAIILLTDGADTASAVTADEVLVRARRSDALIYALSLDSRAGRPVTDGPTATFLRQAAEQTGGQLAFPQLDNLRRLYSDISEELHHQYLIGYVSDKLPSRSAWRTITVRLKGNRDHRLRHRQGYYAVVDRSTR